MDEERKEEIIEVKPEGPVRPEKPMRGPEGPVRGPDPAKNKKDRKGFAIAALVLGIVALVLFCIYYISIPCGILAIIFGILAIKSSGKGMAIAGLVTGSIGLFLTLLIFLFIVVLGFSIFQHGIDAIDDTYDFDYEYEDFYDYY